MKRIAFLLSVTLLLGGCAVSGDSSSSQAQLGEDQTQYYGKVISAVGNEITLQIGSLQSDGITQTNQESTGAPEGEDSTGQSAPEGVPAAPGDGSMDEGGQTPPDGEPSSDGQQMDRQAMGVQLDYTGEERQITIPVGVTVTRSMAGSTLSTDFTAISADQILQVTEQSNQDGSVVVAVSIVS